MTPADEDKAPPAADDDAEWGTNSSPADAVLDGDVASLRQKLLETFYDYHSAIGEQVALVDALIDAARREGMPPHDASG